MAEPTNKAPGIEAFLTLIAGHDRRESIRADKCMPPPIGCGKQLTGTPADFRDDKSAQEYRITGICQACQDRTFGA